MSIRSLGPDEQKEIAESAFPGFGVALDDIMDLPSAINRGEFIPLIRPTVYYKVTEYEGGERYALYCVFWYKDLKSPHNYDFSGFLVCGEKSIVRHHWGFKVVDTPIVAFSAGDHNCQVDQVHTCMIAYGVDGVVFQNMEDPRFVVFAQKCGIFGDAVTPPWQWMSPECREAGLIYYDPQQFAKIYLKEEK